MRQAALHTECGNDSKRKVAAPTPLVENGVSALRTDLTIFATLPAAAAE